MRGEPDRRATLLVLDGGRPDVFRDLLEAGDPANTAERVVEPGGPGGPLRAVDLCPLILRHPGRDVPEGVDGEETLPPRGRVP